MFRLMKPMKVNGVTKFSSKISLSGYTFSEIKFYANSDEIDPDPPSFAAEFGLTDNWGRSEIIYSQLGICPLVTSNEKLSEIVEKELNSCPFELDDHGTFWGNKFPYYQLLSITLEQKLAPNTVRGWYLQSYARQVDLLQFAPLGTSSEPIGKIVSRIFHTLNLDRSEFGNRSSLGQSFNSVNYIIDKIAMLPAHAVAIVISIMKYCQSPILAYSLVSRIIIEDEFNVMINYMRPYWNAKILDGCVKPRLLKKQLEISKIFDELNAIEELHRILSIGETYSVEFKATLRKNTKFGNIEKSIEAKSLKTIVAFLNCDGGRLIIGVDDNGEICGIENDGFENSDKFLLHLVNIVRDRIEPNITDLIKPSIHILGNKSICLVECNPSNTPVRLKGDDGGFYIRNGPSSSRLKERDEKAYLDRRFK